MRAIVHDSYGPPDVLRLVDIERPAVGPDSVLVRVRAASLNAFDSHIMRGQPYLVRTSAGFRKPKRAVAGVDFAGTVEAVGSNVTEMRSGDDVYGERGGAFAEYVDARVDGIAAMPPGVTFEEAAAIPMAGFTALQALRDKGSIQSGQRVLVNGAAGGVGTFAVQIAAALGATVTGVCGPDHVAMVRSIGAASVIDYTREDFTRSTEPYDLIVDVASNRPLAACRRAMRPGAALVVVGAPPGQWLAPVLRPLAAVIQSRLGSQRFLPFLAERRKADLLVLNDLVAAGRLSPVIDRTYPLADTAEAMRYLERGHAGGKVVIAI